MSLEEFAAQQPKRIRCNVCLLPEELRLEVDAAQGCYTATVVAGYMKTRDHRVGVDSIRRHWRDHI